MNNPDSSNTRSKKWSDVCKNLSKFGMRSASEVAQVEGSSFPTQLPEIDQQLGGGLPRNTISEIISPHLSCGSTRMLHQLLASNCQQSGYTALVDACDRFSPLSVGDFRHLKYLYWVRCRGTEEALRVSDILANDQNFSLLLIDLRGADSRVLSQIPGNRWYRLQRALKKNQCTCISLTSFSTVPAATFRLELDQLFSIHALDEPVDQLDQQITAKVLKSSQPQVRYA